ncbi:MAG: alpha/beta fold hydrolase, partial [Oceanococcus sp.]
VGSGRSCMTAFNPDRYSRLEGYAQDIQEICDTLDLENVVLVEHSVSCMIGLLASFEVPKRIVQHIMLGPSPCFLNCPPDYGGGFERSDLEELLNLMDKNYIGWANYLAPLVMGEESSEPLTGELSGSFCSTDPVVAKAFARATFLSDFRQILPQVQQPVLILQSEVDALASKEVGEYVHKHLPNSTFQVLPAQGHCLHMTHPKLVLNALQQYLVTP